MMPIVTLIGFSSVLADVDRYRNMGRHFRPDGSSLNAHDWLTPLIILGAVIAIGWGLHLAHTWWKKYRRCNPSALFQQLCQAHGLSRSDRLLLKQTARRLGLPRPDLLFVDAQWFAPATCKVAAPQRVRQEQLRDRIFGQLLKTTPS